MNKEVKPVTIALVVLALAGLLFGAFRYCSGRMGPEQRPVTQEQLQRMMNQGPGGGAAQQPR